MRWIISLLLVAIPLAGASRLARRIDRIIRSSPAAEGAFVGVKVVEVERGRTLVELNAKRPFLPASNTKLFTTALGLARLGPDYRFETIVGSDSSPDGAGRLAGDLRLIGGGDPTLSARSVPYHLGPDTGDPLAPLEALADQVFASGVRRIDGNIVGDDTAFVWEPYTDGWDQDDALWEYGAPVSALMVNDNVFRLRLEPAGSTAALSLSPEVEFFSIDNRVRVAPGLANLVELERLPGSRQLRVWGTLRSPVDRFLAMDDPALWAARIFASALARRGIVVAGRPVALHRYRNEAGSGAEPRPAVVLARRTSPPLLELLRIIDKASQNLHAEVLLREVGRARGGAGTRPAGLEQEKQFLAACGITPDEYRLVDGSGLSGLDLVTPEAVVKLLLAMHGAPAREQWISLLPVGGRDGTLEHRFGGRPEALRIRAKTGSLSQASALSGYVETRKGKTLAFSILINNFTAPAAEIRRVIDRIALTLAGQ
ncbi:MAG TPA: D-alanyl-D-alanine carboxypeptidase/D-alanyl-D-alanine-endopeptidase [Bryobacteraceae bacterium]|nr:D-alanyl-D-alanine carboxypeptidase/D-alanyl-D-alanine-endopeptidase [Bryobacteraceae bacterium]